MQVQSRQVQSSSRGHINAPLLYHDYDYDCYCCTAPRALLASDWREPPLSIQYSPMSNG